MLLSHRSGIFDYFAHPRYERKVFGRPRHDGRSARSSRCRPALLRAGQLLPLLQHQLRAARQDRTQGHRQVGAQEIRRRFLEPLGLTDTFFQGQEKIGKFPAEGYWWTGMRLQAVRGRLPHAPQHVSRHRGHAAGAIVSSVRDISDWQDALLGGDVLAPESMELMPTFHQSSGYGLGMRGRGSMASPGIGHGGSLRGFVSIMYRLPDEDLDVVILTNLGRTRHPGPCRQAHPRHPQPHRHA